MNQLIAATGQTLPSFTQRHQQLDFPLSSDNFAAIHPSPASTPAQSRAEAESLGAKRWASDLIFIQPSSSCQPSALLPTLHRSVRFLLGQLPSLEAPTETCFQQLQALHSHPLLQPRHSFCLDPSPSPHAIQNGNRQRHESSKASNEA